MKSCLLRLLTFSQKVQQPAIRLARFLGLRRGTFSSKYTQLYVDSWTDPDIRWRIADMALAYDALPPQIAALSDDVDWQVDHGARWFSLLA